MLATNVRDVESKASCKSPYVEDVHRVTVLVRQVIGKIDDDVLLSAISSNLTAGNEDQLARELLTILTEHQVKSLRFCQLQVDCHVF